MKEPFYFLTYTIVVCLTVREIAGDRCHIGIRVPPLVRRFLLIFSFEQYKISIWALLSQINFYLSLALFLAINLFLTPEALAASNIDFEKTLDLFVFINHLIIIVGQIDINTA